MTGHTPAAHVAVAFIQGLAAKDFSSIRGTITEDLVFDKEQD